MNLIELIGHKPVFFCGAMGTMLQSRGLGAGLSSDAWTLTHPEEVYAVHKAYLDAGCDMIKTNTFSTNRLRRRDYAKAVRAACEIARRAAADTGGDRAVCLDIGPTGRLLAPMGDLSFEEAVSVFADVIVAGREFCDAILIETMSDLYEIKAAVIAAKENCSLPIFVTMTIDENGRLLTGADIPTAVAVLEGLGVAALGLNCGLGPLEMEKHIPALLEFASVPVIVNPNAGMPHDAGGKAVYSITPDVFAASVKRMMSAGVAVAGGCCGTTPKFISQTVAACRDIKLTPPTPKNDTVVTSYSRRVVIGGDSGTVIIGERINPTGKPKLKAALRAGDYSTITKIALEERDAGAHILDVNAGLPDIDETAALTATIQEIQATLDLPLQLDSANADALTAAMRIYNGKPLVNSVSGRRDVMDAIFPLVKKYGGVVVGLTLDENGIPDTAEGRAEIAGRIIKTAAEYGIDKKDIIIDTLTMAVAADPASAAVTLDALSLVRERYGVPTVLGVSNVSFGLPTRDTVNAAFFTLAMEHGLSAAIINPQSDNMLGAYYAYRLLHALDPGAAAYTAFAAAHPATQTQPTSTVKPQEIVSQPVTAPKSQKTLKDAIINGLIADAGALAANAVMSMSAMEVINGEIIPALEEVGRGFESNRIFLPQLMRSADAAKAAFDTIKAAIAKNEDSNGKSGGVIVLATVRGDIHDIGKNIVRVLLESHGYDVVDLGRDVPAEDIVATIKRTGARLAGLSALTTATVESMEKTIAEIKKAAPGCLVMVGGAVLTETAAQKIGADFYGADATDAVRIASDVYGR
ncbi:MAG: homocysteine S-methyltransferase family protein [Eubacteriales bacterium]